MRLRPRYAEHILNGYPVYYAVRREPMKDDDQDDRMFLLRLNRDERRILAEMVERYKAKSRTTAIRTCIRIMGERMRLDPDL